MSVNLQRTGRGSAIAILVVIMLALAIVNEFQGWRFLFLALVGAWWISRSWARSLASGLKLEREMRFGWAQVGDRLEERFTLTNQGRLPALWVEIEDHSDLPGYQPGRVTGVENGQALQWRAEGQCLQRGVFHLGPATLRCADPLGLYQVTIEHSSRAALTVTPPIAPLPAIEVSPGGRAVQGRPRREPAERTVSAETVRPYVPGDNLRWVHWRTSARREALYIRTFESTPSGDWWIILDLDEAVQAGSAPRSTEEHAVILAASLADRGLRLGRAVGLACGGRTPPGSPAAWLPPRGGETQRWAVLRSLAVVHPSSQGLARVLSSLRSSLTGSASLVIITSNMRGEWLESLLPLLWKGSQPTILLLDPAAFDNNTGVTGEAAALTERLARQGLRHYRILPDLLDRPEARPGRRGRWEWRVTPSGRAILVDSGGDAGWKRLP